MHEVLGKAITCQTSSIIFSLTRLFFFSFSADAHDLEAAGLFVLWLFFFFFLRISCCPGFRVAGSAELQYQKASAIPWASSPFPMCQETMGAWMSFWTEIQT